MLLGDAGDARRRASGRRGRGARPRCRSSGRAPSSPVAMPRRVASRGESSTSRSGRWNCELGHALDGGPGEERRVARASCDEVAVGRRGARAALASAGGAGALGAAAQRRRARRRRRTRGRRRSGRELLEDDAACGESSTPKRSASRASQASSSGDRRDHGAAQPLHAALEVHRSCRRARGSSSPGGRGPPSRRRAAGTS